MDYEVLAAAVAVVGVLLWIHRDLKADIRALNVTPLHRDVLWTAGTGQVAVTTRAGPRVDGGERVGVPGGDGGGGAGVEPPIPVLHLTCSSYDVI